MLDHPHQVELGVVQDLGGGSILQELRPEVREFPQYELQSGNFANDGPDRISLLRVRVE